MSPTLSRGALRPAPASPVSSFATRALGAALLLLLLAPAAGQGRMTEEPKSFELPEDSLERVERVTLKPIDPRQLRAAEERRRPDPREPEPYRFAVTEEVRFDLAEVGTREELPDGHLHRLVIVSPGALSLSVGLTRFDLPEGAKLWIYAPDRERVEGPYTARDRSHHGRLWTPVIEGEEVVLELFVPADEGDPVVVVGTVHKGFRVFGKGGAQKNHGACNNDVVCPEGAPWADQIRSVARYTIDGMFLCTGQLVNNTAVDFTPYFLSAAHCDVDATNDDTLVFYWNYESVNCGDQGGGSLADNQTGSIYRAAYDPSDFLLVELSQDPAPASNVYFTGWDAGGGAAASTVAIHHPSGDVKSISFNTNAVTSTAYLSNAANAGANHWRVDDWEDGTTEGGSSGSCLWDAATQRCVGQLHGGFASCAAPNDADWYGKLSVSWNGGGAAASRLRDWLDPGNTGVVALDGDPHITTLDGTHYDFQGAGEFVVLRDGGGSEIQVRQAPIATTFFPGANPHHGLATCASLNTAVAARVGERRVTYQPNLSGVPDPSGLELRVDGRLTRLGAGGIDLGQGGRLEPTDAPGGLRVVFPDRYTLLVTPGWWSSQEAWYLNLSVVRSPARAGVGGASPGAGGGTGGLGGAIPRGSWLPRLPDGSSIGAMPSSLDDRYTALYQKFGEAWRVTDASSLFDYAPGTSTESFTFREWPLRQGPCRLPDARPAEPLDPRIAERACRLVVDANRRANCVFDVTVTGELGFAQTYLHSERAEAAERRGEDDCEPCEEKPRRHRD